MDAGFFTAVRNFKFTSRRHRISDDDAVDRINSYYAPVLIVILSTVIMTKMYLIGDPIQCWIPREFTGAWEEYAESYCWVKNTYFVAPNESLPDTQAEGRQKELKYYQWVPFVLALQALFFYLPSVLWKLLNWQSGIQLKSLVEMAVNCPDDDPKVRQDKVDLATRHIEFSIVNKEPKDTSVTATLKRFCTRVLCCGLAKSGNYLTVTYLLVKLLYIGNCLLQFALLKWFLGTEYDFYGLQVLIDLWRSRDWRHSGHFPRVTYCDFNIRAIGNTHPRTLQCVLVVNLLNEKLFIFVWFLLLVSLVLSVLSTADWLLWWLLPGRKFRSLRLAAGQPRTPEEQRQLREFSDSYVKADGAFVMRMVAKNAGGPVANSIQEQLWLNFCQARQEAAAADTADKMAEAEGLHD